MSRMYSFWKPARLWNLTGNKHYLALQEGRQTPEHRDRSSMLRFMLFPIASTLAMMYMFGMFSPPRIVTTVLPVKEPPVCDDTPTCDIPEKCPTEKITPLKPCPPSS